MKPWIIRLAVLATIGSSGAVQADVAPLSADALARCATQVQGLRTESARLIQKSAHFDALREGINRKTQNLDAKAAALPADDLKNGLAVHDEKMRHNQDTAAFNNEVAQLRQEIINVNVVKQDYERNCSNRPYRRADLERLPEAQRNAMRIGLSDVSVPYLDSPYSQR